MTPQDRTLAREALVQKKLTIDQVTELQKECESSRASLADAAVRRGLLTPDDVASLLGVAAPPAPALFSRLLVATLVILVLVTLTGFAQLASRNARDRRLAEESMRSRAETERLAREAGLAYQRKQLADRETDAGKSLEQARTIMRFVEERLRDAPAEPQLHLQLVEATGLFNAALQIRENDPAILVERARAYELRRDFERALADLDRAIELKKELAPGLDAKLNTLRLQVSRPKK